MWASSGKKRNSDLHVLKQPLSLVTCTQRVVSSFGIMQILLALLVYTQKMLFNFILCIKNNACVQFNHILLSARYM